MPWMPVTKEMEGQLQRCGVSWVYGGVHLGEFQKKTYENLELTEYILLPVKIRLEFGFWSTSSICMIEKQEK